MRDPQEARTNAHYKEKGMLQYKVGYPIYGMTKFSFIHTLQYDEYLTGTIEWASMYANKVPLYLIRHRNMQGVLFYSLRIPYWHY